MSQGLKNWQFESNLSKITRPVAAIKSPRFAFFFLFFFGGGGGGGRGGVPAIPLRPFSATIAPQQRSMRSIKRRSVGDQMRPENAPFALRWRCLRHAAFSSRSDCVVGDPYWSVCDARDPITIRSSRVGCNLINTCGVRMWLSMYNDRRKAYSDLKWQPTNFDIDFLVLNSFFHNMVRCWTNTVIGWPDNGLKL